MTRNSSPSPVDWLATARGGVIDLRLPGDPADVPSAVWIARTLEYYAQRTAGRRPARPAPAPPVAALEGPPARDPDDPGFAQDDLFA